MGELGELKKQIEQLRQRFTQGGVVPKPTLAPLSPRWGIVGASRGE